MGILAVYDTVGIQEYIFSSNKLAENVGASKLVADIFDKFLPDIIMNATDSNHVFEWKKAINKELFSGGADVEIVYQGGGNAYVAFKGDEDKSLFQKVTKELLIETNLKARGIGIAVAAVETDFKDNYHTNMNDLKLRLALVKNGFNTPVFAGNQSISKQSAGTGLPVSHIYEQKGEEREFVYISQKLKRDRYIVYKEEIKSKIKNFDDLAFEKGVDSLIAIIHADGNNMGSRITEYMNKGRFKSYKDAVPGIRKLAKSIDDCYKNARDNTIDSFRIAYKEYIDNLERENRNKNSVDKKCKTEPPILELIGDGDDTTVVMGGRFALDFAARLLREIEKQNDPFDEGKKPTACAGVVIFNSHYPFSSAYTIAEELCSSAKKPSRDIEGSYIDFHLHQSGGIASLSKIRNEQYTIKDKTIFRRPWRVSTDKDNAYPDFVWFECNIERISGLPNNKTKSLRNAIGAGDEAAKLVENQFRDVYSKKIEEPKIVNKPDNISDYAARFDILEMSDAYVNLLNKMESKDGC